MSTDRSLPNRPTLDHQSFASSRLDNPTSPSPVPEQTANLASAFLLGCCLILGVGFWRLERRRVSWCGCGVEGVGKWERAAVAITLSAQLFHAGLSSAITLNAQSTTNLAVIIDGASQSIIQGSILVFLCWHVWHKGIIRSSSLWKGLLFGLGAVAVGAAGLGAWLAVQLIVIENPPSMLTKLEGVLTVAAFTLSIVGLSVVYMHCGAGAEVIAPLVGLGAFQGAGVFVWLTEQANWTALLVLPLPLIYELALLLVLLVSHASNPSHLCIHKPRPPLFAVKLPSPIDEDHLTHARSSIYSSDRDHPPTIIDLPDPATSPSAIKPPPPSVRTTVGSVLGVTSNSRWSADTSELLAKKKKGRFRRLRSGADDGDAVPPVPPLPGGLTDAGGGEQEKDWSRALEVELEHQETIMDKIGAVLDVPFDGFGGERAGPRRFEPGPAQGRAPIQYPQRSHTIDVVPNSHFDSYAYGTTPAPPLPDPQPLRYHTPAPRWYTPPSTFRPDFPAPAAATGPAAPLAVQINLRPPSGQFAQDTRHDSGGSDTSLAYLAPRGESPGLLGREDGGRLRNPYSPGFSFARGLGGGEGGSGRFKGLRRSFTAPAAGWMGGSGEGGGQVKGLERVQEQEEVVWMGGGAAGGRPSGVMGAGQR